LKELDNKWKRAIELWFSQVKDGYIIEFVIEYIDYFNEAKRKFAEGPIKKMLEEISL
jgi:hypothetical protein